MRTSLMLAIVLAALTVGAAPGRAASVAVTSGGLVVNAAGDGSSSIFLQVSPGVVTASGEIASWLVESDLCEPPGLNGSSCLTSVGAGCHVPSAGEPGAGALAGARALCNRTVPGVRITTTAGADDVFPRIGADPLTVDLGAGNDKLHNDEDLDVGQSAATGPWQVTGGAGNDVIFGSTGGNVIDGGSGDDTIRSYPQRRTSSAKKTLVTPAPERSAGDSIFGGSGDDSIDPGFGPDAVSAGEGDDLMMGGSEGEATTGADAFDGGRGFDEIDYSARTSNLFFDSGSAQSGSVGISPHELDRDSGIEHVVLGSGDDTALSLIDQLPARVIEGRAGDDVLNGISGSDDEIIGGPGADKLNGFGGDDLLDAVDGEADRSISCGDGADVARLDLRDPNPLDAAVCETITRAAVKEAPVVRLASARRVGRGVRVTLSCPAKNDRSCKGTLRGGGARIAYQIARGRMHRVLLRGVHVKKLRVTSVERGRYGAKTVIRTLTVR